MNTDIYESLVKDIIYQPLSLLGGPNVNSKVDKIYSIYSNVNNFKEFKEACESDEDTKNGIYKYFKDTLFYRHSNVNDFNNSDDEGYGAKKYQLIRQGGKKRRRKTTKRRKMSKRRKMKKTNKRR